MTVKKTPSTALVANGIIHNYSFIANLLKSYSRIVAVDGGLKHCDAMGILPDAIIGDLDSATQDLLQKHAHIPIKRYPVEKDDTDLELAIKQEWAESAHPLTVFGAMEGRVDHSMYNLQLLCRYPQKLFFETELEILFAFTSKILIPAQLGQIISFLSIGKPAKGVFTKGLKWELSNATLDSHFMSISNVCLKETIEVNIEEGTLLCSKHRNVTPPV